LVAGGGVAGAALGKLLSRRGVPVTVLQVEAAARARHRWAIVPAGLGRTLPPGSLLEAGLPVDLVLAGGHRIETHARVSIVDVDVLLDTWRRHAHTAGAVYRTGTPVRGALRRQGRVAGVELEDGSILEASVTVDATGRGALLRSLFGAGLRAASFEHREREAIASACASADPRQIQSSWAGRAQILLGLDRVGAMAWRCTTRSGERIFAAASAGPGATRSDSIELLGNVVESLEADASVSWRACRRPTDVLTHDGLMSLGGAAAALDSLTGISIPHILRAVEMGLETLAVPAIVDSATKADLFPTSSAFMRCSGADLAVRHAVRRFFHSLRPEEREAAVLSGALGVPVWHAAASGGHVAPALRWARLTRRGCRGRQPGAELVRQCLALRAHYHRYPTRHDRFALDLWQARTEELFSR